MNTYKDKARSRALVGTALVALLAVAACGGGDSGQQDQPPAPAGNAADATPAAGMSGTAPGSGTADTSGNSGSVTLAGVSFTPPSGWQDLGPTGMRQAQYRLEPVAGDTAPGEVNVFYFGPNSGGGVEANLQRWIGQIVLPEGADPATAVARDTFTADGMAGHLVSVDGSYKSGGMMRPMGGGGDGDGEILPGYRLVGVVVEGPQGSLFFKLTGPVATAKAMEDDLLAMVQGARQ
ncbi:MAG: hypothetical protein R6X35_04670 [Candidatus Krumholzibacteriia bacterium]